MPTEKLPSQAETAMPRRRGDITVKVADYEAARERILQALAIQGAELVEAKTLVNEKGRKHGWVTVRLDADRLPDALPVVRAAGKLYEENVTTSDDTSEYQTLARRADGLQKHQGRLAGILSSERRLRGSDILYVQERLFRASVDEGLLLQQRKDIERGSRTCTVTIRLFEPMPTRALDRVRLDLAGHFAAAKGRATGVVDQARARAVTASAYALVFAPVWVPLLIVLFIALHLLTRAVLIPLWFRRAEIALWLLSAARSLYALLPERVRKPVSRVRGAIRTPPPAAGAGD
ncbi:MAG: DUF4349 domain-containing protein [Cytophagales bacterium]|nr:DUF4349 domain-containing protein [Armatimonadota bacterium]